MSSLRLNGTQNNFFTMMKTLTINLSDETADRLEAFAERLGVSAEELVRSSVEEQFQSLDNNFEEASQHVLAKNAELYRRLA